jgi:LuxR family transcriptional regulator, maltose regulon positive regulatory protein
MENQKSKIKEPQFPLLATKLFVPHPRPDQVNRSHLIDQLDDGISRKLTLISAPAGFGKTTLLSEWIAQSNLPVAWISLDKGDGDPVQFIHYLIAALRKINPELGKNAIAQLQATRNPPVESILISLITETSELDDDLVIVLDDYHAIEEQVIHGLIKKMLDNLPPHIHLVISTRVDPPLPLARLRVSQQLSELRTVNLCFTSAEITALFNQNMNLQLSENDISILESRTEGWAAGLQLAAISMQDREDISSFIETFAGDDRHVVDYLVEEVLSSQPKPIQHFLLRTSILNRLSAPLCEFLTGEKNSQQVLDQLEKANLFIVSLDTRRQWFRYHHLFADLLHQRLHQSEIDQVDELHTKASQWYEENDSKEEAVNHALEANDNSRAAQLISDYIRNSWEYDTRMSKWHQLLPLEVIHQDPELSFFNAWMLYENGQYDASEENLDIVEGLVDSQLQKVKEGTVSVNFKPSEWSGELYGKVTAIRSIIALFKGNIPEVFTFSEKAIEYLDQSSSSWRLIAIFALAQAYFSREQMDKANQQYQKAASGAEETRNHYIYLITRLGMASVMKFQGQLSRALDIFEELLKHTQETGLSKSPMLGILYINWGEVLMEQNYASEAVKNIQQGLELAEQVNEVATFGRGYAVLAKALFLKGDISHAEETIEQAEKLGLEVDFPNYVTNILEELKVRIWLHKGDVKQAGQWMQNQPSVQNETYKNLTRSRLILISRIRLAQGELANSVEMLKALVKTASRSEVVLHIEVLVIQAKMLFSEGELPQAVSSVREAVSLAEQGGFISIFVQEGAPIPELLQVMLDEGTNLPRAFINKILSAFRLTKLIRTEDEFVERLSERELEILRLIAAGLPNKTITEELYISLSTVKTHIRNIYSKLNVNSRTQAVNKAKELNLL